MTYGAVTKTTGTVDTPFKYAGRLGVITDGDGLVYLKTRYYNPQLMRFMNRDTVAGSVTDSQSLNRFSYVEGNPLTYVDLNGQARTWLNDNVGFLGGLGWDALEFVPVLGNVMSAVDLIGDLASGEGALTIGADMLGIFGGGEFKGAGKALEFASHLRLASPARISDEVFSRFGRQYKFAGIGDFGRQYEFAGFSDFDRLGTADGFGSSSTKLQAYTSDSLGASVSGRIRSKTDLDNFDKSFIKRTKPSHSPRVEKWLNNGGTIDISKDETWTLTNSEGISVSYPNGYPDFKTAGLVDGEVNIGKFVERGADIRKAKKLRPDLSGYPYTWHHDAIQNGTLQAVKTKYHKEFLHSGGISRFVSARR